MWKNKQICVRWEICEQNNSTISRVWERWSVAKLNVQIAWTINRNDPCRSLFQVQPAWISRVFDSCPSGGGGGGVYFFWNNPLTSRAFCRKHMSFWTFLVMGQISSNLLKEASATWQDALLSTNIAFYDVFAWTCPEIKILSGFSTESNLRTSLGFSVFLFFFFTFL